MPVADFITETGNCCVPLRPCQKRQHWQDLDCYDRVPVLEQDIAIVQAAQLRFW